MDRARQNDLQALQDLLGSFRPHIRSLVEKLLAGCSPGQAEQRLEEGLQKARQEFPDFSGSTLAEFVVWLQRTVRAALGRNEEERAAGDRESRDDSLRILRIMEALAQVPLDQQQVLLGRHLDPLNFAELAQELGWSEPAVRSAYVQGICRLHEHYRGV